MSRFGPDKHGNTVEPAVIEGRACFIPRGPDGAVLGLVRGVKQLLPNTPEQLAALGVDLDTLTAPDTGA